MVGRQMVAFPGGGGDHPLAPGQVALVAVSAIDHTEVHPSLPDLSGAAFEIRGVASVDNPLVPDMLDVGLAPFVQDLGGSSLTRLSVLRQAFFISDPITPGSLPVAYRDGNGQGWVQVPRESLIDVVGLTVILADADRQFSPCIPLVHPSFDRYEGGFLTIAMGLEEPRLSYQRRVLRSGGTVTLQDANTSAVDFILADLTPGTLPPP